MKRTFDWIVALMRGMLDWDVLENGEMVWVRGLPIALSPAGQCAARCVDQ
jgi:hypothetical protein